MQEACTSSQYVTSGGTFPQVLNWATAPHYVSAISTGIWENNLNVQFDRYVCACAHNFNVDQSSKEFDLQMYFLHYSGDYSGRSILSIMFWCVCVGHPYVGLYLVLKELNIMNQHNIVHCYVKQYRL